MNISPSFQPQRHVILHNHLFKNAGTSVDRILQQNFGPLWQSAEFMAEGADNTQAVADWISKTPTAAAFSTHTLRGPVPQISGVTIIPLVLLRDPVARIASAYRFERAQKAETRGARLAKAHGFAGYVHARLSTQGDRQCRNFQTNRLAILMPDAPGSELDRARAAAHMIWSTGVLGEVAHFGMAMDLLQERLMPHHPDFRWQPITANAAGNDSAQLVSPEMRARLVETNQDDLELLDYVRRLLRHAGTGASAAQAAGTG